MLKITIPKHELYDEATNTFSTLESDVVLRLEHSLLSLSKWESKWCVPFLKTELTREQTIDYIRCMTITQNVDPTVYDFITNDNVLKVTEYIKAPMTATWFSETNGNGKGGNGRTITAELIYYWMIALQIPFECEKWHLNKLLTLIRVCNIENQPPKKMSKKDVAKNNNKLNAARRAKMHSRG